MYGIGNNYYNYSQLFSTMSGLHNSFGFHCCNSRNHWNTMVPNYAQINDSLLGGIMYNNYSRLKAQMDAQMSYESASREFNSEFDSAFSQLKEASSALKSYSGDSVFHPTGYGSSNSDVATVTGSAAGVSRPVHLEVMQTAASTSYSSEALAFRWLCAEWGAYAQHHRR